MVVEASSGPKTPAKRGRPRKTDQTPSSKAAKVADAGPSSVVKGTPGRKRKTADDVNDAVTKRRQTTPAGKASPAPRGRTSSAKKAAVTPGTTTDDVDTPRKVGRPRKDPGSARKTPTKAEPSTPTAKSVKKTPSSMVATLKAASVAAAKPSPRGRKPKIVEAAADEPLPSFDDAFGGDDTPAGKDSSISRETFLANEALRRQREARNFVFEGDAQAPRLTRSGRIVKQRKTLALGEADEDGEDVGIHEDDLYGSAQPAPEEEDTLQAADGVLDTRAETTLSTAAVPSRDVPMVSEEIQPLPAAARSHVLDILATLTGVSAGINPPPFHDEDTNEALQGLVNLLRGTVERGEGNSALVVGPRGSGKTRVSGQK